MPVTADGGASGGEYETAARPAESQLFRHLLFGEVDEILTAVTHRRRVFDVE